MRKEFTPAPPQVKACMQLVDAFSDTYKAVAREEDADELFTVGRIREYFNAWPIPKMPDPLPPYLDALESRGFAMQTSYDGQPAIFVVRWRSNGEICGTVEEVEEKQSMVRSGAQEIKAVLDARKILYGQREPQQPSGYDSQTYQEEESSEEEEEYPEEEEEDPDDPLGTFGINLSSEDMKKVPF